MSWDMNEAIAYYKKQGAPGDQNALIALLREIQTECGGSVPPQALNQISEIYCIKDSLLHALIRRIPSLRLGNHHSLVVCAGPNCGKAAVLAACAEKLCREHKDTVSLQFSPCMRMCGKGPNIKWDGMIHHQATEELLQKLLK